MFCRVGCAAIHVSRRLHPQWWQRCLVTASEWKRWQRRCDRLTKLQQRIQFPPPTSFTVEGVAYTLPLKAVSPPEQEPTQEELEYLIGFFDGDGCVTMDSSSGTISLQMSQSIDSAQVLLLFRDKLGGGLSRHSNGTGLKKACLRWRAYSSNMQHAALLLGRVPCMKQSQLQIAACTPIEKADRAKVAEQLKFFKRKDYCPKNLTITWPQLAGFFDAEGSVTIHASCIAIKLSIWQANPSVLKHLLVFLHTHGLEKWRLYLTERSSELSCTDLATAKQTLELLLSSGLLIKRVQAQLALSLNAYNRQQVRRDVINLNGWQSRYSYLDKDGSVLARKLNAFQTQTRRNRCKKEREEAGKVIEDLKEELAFHKLVCRCRYLRTHIRTALMEGACIMPV